MQIPAGPLLQTINSPADLKNVPKEKLHQVCDELRQYIIDVVSVHGGHFAAWEQPDIFSRELREAFRKLR